MDFLNILVNGDLLATFVNLFCVTFALDFVSGIVAILSSVKGAIR